MQSCRDRKKSDNSEGQIQSTVSFSSQTRRVCYALVVACHFINLFFFFLCKINFAKKGQLCSSACYIHRNMRVKRDLLRQ